MTILKNILKTRVRTDMIFWNMRYVQLYPKCLYLCVQSSKITLACRIQILFGLRPQCNKSADVNLLFICLCVQPDDGYKIGRTHVADCTYTEYMLCLTDCKLVFILALL